MLLCACWRANGPTSRMRIPEGPLPLVEGRALRVRYRQSRFSRGMLRVLVPKNNVLWLAGPPALQLGPDSRTHFGHADSHRSSLHLALDYVMNA
jgi:hypothetical protein